MMGLKGDEQFTPELQSRLALQFGKNWSGDIRDGWIGLQKATPEELAAVRAGLGR